MKRIDFLAGALGGAFAICHPERSNAAQRRSAVEGRADQRGGQALRVLLGKGNATNVDAQSFTFNGKRYRGAFDVLPDTNEVVSTVDLEQYLYSVVSREMPHSWPRAALETQAIVARTYVLQRSDPTRGYDLVPSEADQVYTGMDAESEQTTQAVDATGGSVLRYANGFARLFYSSCCGGHTEASGQAWGGETLDYLGGVPCENCKDSPWYSWSRSVTIESVQSGLGNALSVGAIEGVQLDPPDESGRPLFWTFAGNNGTARIKAADVRHAIGTRTLPSLRVNAATLADETIALSGGGLGHGVGLCQWGARGLAQSGVQAREILTFYFPGTTIAVV